ncbi:metallophosphatase family protein [Frankia sp. Ag45/Mut15]|uniref:Metallophosphatase family protein n=1 Tax=Frankia umida TaxID=573489 RepID=A0ABT0JZM2_9ACTN|nr:metallophosphoesterase [Frankia umida]MCK9876989.1 metallophosphatase family protein [Frankia umida]
MRYALFADLHGRPKALERIMVAAERAGADELVCLGDYLEARVPRRLHDPGRDWSLPAVVDRDPPLWRRLATVRRIRGNQEERIRELLRPERTPPELAALLDAPAWARLHGLLALHGHQIRWDLVTGTPPARLSAEPRPPAAPSLTPRVDPTPAVDLLVPRAADVPRWPVVVVGHTHQNAVFEIDWPTESVRPAEPPVRMISVGPGEVLRVPPAPVSPESVSSVGGSAVLVPPATGLPTGGLSGVGGRTLVVNVGPARGRMQNWLLYDTDRGEICFHAITRPRKESERARSD